MYIISIIHIIIYIYIHTYRHTYIRTYVHTYIYMHTQISLCAHTHYHSLTGSRLVRLMGCRPFGSAPPLRQRMYAQTSMARCGQGFPRFPQLGKLRRFPITSSPPGCFGFTVASNLRDFSGPAPRRLKEDPRAARATACGAPPPGRGPGPHVPRCSGTSEMTSSVAKSSVRLGWHSCHEGSSSHSYFVSCTGPASFASRCVCLTVGGGVASRCKARWSSACRRLRASVTESSLLSPTRAFFCRIQLDVTVFQDRPLPPRRSCQSPLLGQPKKRPPGQAGRDRDSLVLPLRGVPWAGFQV